MASIGNSSNWLFWSDNPNKTARAIFQSCQQSQNDRTHCPFLQLLDGTRRQRVPETSLVKIKKQDLILTYLYCVVLIQHCYKLKYKGTKRADVWFVCDLCAATALLFLKYDIWLFFIAHVKIAFIIITDRFQPETLKWLVWWPPLHGCSNSTILLHQKTVCVAHEENGTCVCVYMCVCELHQ